MMRKVWAVARVTIAQSIRMKVPLVIVLFLIVLVPALPFVLESASVAGEARIVASYSLYLLIFLMSVLTMFLSAATISKEIEDKQIFVLDPKPVARWQVFLGKWLGVMIINVGLVVVLGG